MVSRRVDVDRPHNEEQTVRKLSVLLVCADRTHTAASTQSEGRAGTTATASVPCRRTLAAVAAVVLLLLGVVGGGRAASAATATPSVRADSFVTDEDTAHTFNPLQNDTGSLVASSVTTTQPLHGTTSADPATAFVTYTPSARYNGADRFFYTV